jgi:hypothetical protein
MNDDDRRRLDQEEAIFADGNEDAAEIARGEILTTGPQAQMPLEEYVRILLSDLTENDKAI